MKLICLPFAGGSSASFYKWNDQFGKNTEIIVLEYSGHGTRFGEKLMDFDETLEDVYSQLLPHINEEYAIFGHSMGIVYAYELARRLDREGKNKPFRIIVSGSAAPYSPRKRILHTLPKKEFLNEIYKFGGMPGDVSQDDEILDIFYPILFNDVKNLELYRSSHKDDVPNKIDVPLTVLSGSNDKDFHGEDVLIWQQYSDIPIHCREFNGGHFFIFDRMQEVCAYIKEELER